MNMLKASWRSKLLLLVVASGFSVLLAEVVVRVARPGFPGFRTPQIEHRPAKGIGFEMIPDQRGFTFAEPVAINSQGLRSPELKKRSAVDWRVVCLGDSITFGVCVGDTVPYPCQLERLLEKANPDNRVEVINTGVQRYYTYQEIDYFRREVQDLKADVVILGVYYNDLGVRPAGDYSKEYENRREQAATSFRKKVPWLYLLAKNSALIELSKQVYLSRGQGTRHVKGLTGELTEKDEKKWVAMGEELNTFKRLSEEYRFRPLVVTIPARIQVQQAFPKSRFPARVLELCGDLKLPVVNVHEQLVASLKQGDDPYLAWDDHLSETGHRIVAEVLAGKILEGMQKKGTANQR